MDEKYFQDLYNWISSKDNTYSQRYSYDQFKQKMQDESYATQLHGWISGQDETFSERRPLETFVQQAKSVLSTATAQPAAQVQPQPQAQMQPAQPEPVKKKDITASSLAVGSSALSGLNAPQRNVAETTAVAKKQLFPDALTKQTQPQAPKFLEDQIASITPELIGKEEETVVPQMNYQFGPLGFKFEEAGATGDWMNVTAPNGKTMQVSLDPFTSGKEKSEASALREFIRNNSAKIPNIQKFESEYDAANKKFTTDKEVEDIITKSNKQINDFRARTSEIIKRKKQLEDEKKALEETPEDLRMTADFADRVSKFQEQQDQLNADISSASKDEELINAENEKLKANIGNYLAMKDTQGTWYDYLASKFLTGGGRFLSQAKSTVGDLITAVLPDAVIMDSSQWKKGYLRLAKERGIPGPKNDSRAAYENWIDSLDEDMKDDMHDKLVDEVRKEQKFSKLDTGKTIQETIRGFLSEKLGPDISKEYINSLNQGTFSGAIGGAFESIPSFLGGGRGVKGAASRVVRLMMQNEDFLNEEMANDPSFKDVSENEKRLITIPTSIATAVLENIGFRNIISNRGLLNRITMSALGRAGATTTAKTFGDLVRNEVKSGLARGTLTILGGALAEAETGAAQQAAELAAKDIYNLVKNKKDENGDYMKMFDTPDSILGYIGEIAKGGFQEAIGGLVLGIPSAVSAAYRGPGFEGMSDSDFAALEAMANDTKIEKAYIANLKAKITSGDLTTAEAKQMLNDYRNSIGLLNSMPSNLTIGDKKKAMNLLREKRDLERQVEGKDEGLVQPQKNRISEINQELNKLSENAIQEQATDEGVLGGQQPQLGLQEMGQGDVQPEVTAAGTAAIQTLTPEEETRRVTLQEALAQPENEEGTVTVGEELIPREEAQTEFDELNKVYSNTLQGQPSVLSSIEEQKSDIERRRREDLEKLNDPFNLARRIEIRDENGNLITPTEESINAKYDAELAALESKEQTAPVIEAVEQDVTIREMAPVTDAMVGIEREFSNNGYSIDTDYDNEIIVTDKDGEIISPEDLPDNLRQLAADYEKATSKLGEYDAAAREKALANSRQVTEAEAETVEQQVARLEEMLAEEPVIAEEDTGVSISNKSSIADLMARTTDRTKKTIIESAARAVKTLKSILPDFDIVIHDNEGSFNNAVAARNGRLGSAGNFSVARRNGKIVGGRIDINLEKANVRTVAHEVAHGVMLKAFGDNPALFKTFRDRISKILSEERNKNLNRFASEYSETESHEEFLVELAATLSANSEQLSKLAVKRIAELINKVVSKLTNGAIVPFRDVKEMIDTNELINFLNTMSSSIAQGEEIKVKERGGYGAMTTVISKSQTPVKDIDVKDIRTKARPGSRVSKGLSVRTENKKKVVGEAEDLSLDYVRNNAPEIFISNAKILADYPIVSGVQKFDSINTVEDADKVYKIFSREVANNLKFLVDNFKKELVDISTLWYDGANIIAQKFSQQYNISKEQAAGIIASLSPQKDWYMNVRLAELVMMAFDANPVMTKQMVDKQVAINKEGIKSAKKKLEKAKENYEQEKTKENKEKLKKQREGYKNKVLKSNKVIVLLQSYIGKDLNSVPPSIKPYFVRLHHELNTTKDYNELRPDGEVLDLARKDNGTKAKVGWGSYVEIGKAVSIYLDGSQENITKTLGEMHKIRNFYNNIIDPMSADNDVTMDTHAVAAALLMALSGKSKQVNQNFGTGTSNSSPLGIKGLYYAFADGYMLAAKEIGLLPRQVQSITWEAIRGVFTNKFKNNLQNVAAINKIWSDYESGKININETRKRIIERAGGFKDPTWAREKPSIGTGPVQGEPRVSVGKESVGRGGKGVGRGAVRGGERGGAGGGVEVTSRSQVASEVKKLEGMVTSKSQTPSEAQRIVKVGRANGITEDAIRQVLANKGFAQDVIDKAMGVTGTAVRFELSEDMLPGYDSTMAKIEGIVNKVLSERNGTPERAFEAAMAYLQQDSKLYQDATGVQQEKLVRDMRKRFGLKEKAASSVGKLFGSIKDIKNITMSEKAFLANQIKDLARGAKTAIGASKKVGREIMSSLKDLVKNGKITTSQAVTILRKFNNVNMFNQESVDKFLDYMGKVFNDANYAQRIANINKNLKTARKNIKSKIGIAGSVNPILTRILSVNPNLIPESVFDKYEALVEMLGKKALVLELRDINDVRTDATEILDAIEQELSSVPQLKDVFDDYQDKVLDEDGKVMFSDTLNAMVDDGTITPSEAAIMRKYRSKIMPAAPVAPMTQAEIQQEKDELINAISAFSVDAERLPTRDERDLARRISLLISERVLEAMDNKQLKTLLAVLDNINNGYLPHQAQLMVEAMESIVDSAPLENSVETAKPLSISKIYAKAKSIFTGKESIFEMVRRGPLFNIDQIFGDFKTKNIFNAVFKKAADAQASYNASIKQIQNRLDEAYNRVSNSLNNDPNRVRESSYRMMAYLLQLEHQSNPTSKQTKHSALDYLKATIKHINDGKSSFSQKDAEVLQQIFDDMSNMLDAEGKIDMDALYDSFNNAEKQAIKTVQEINTSLRDKAVYTSSVIRGDKITPIENYVHHNALNTNQPDEQISGITDVDNVNNNMQPSTRGKSLISRTGELTPLNFNMFSSANRGANFVLMDYYLTEPIRTARKTLNRTRKNMEERYNNKIPSDKVKVLNAIESAFEEATYNLLTNNMVSNSFIEDVVNEISKQGYRAVLASAPRWVSELTSNMSFALAMDAAAFKKGFELRGVAMSSQAPDIMINLRSKQTARVFPQDALTGRLIDSSILSQTIGRKSGKSINGVANKVQTIYNNSLKKYKNFIELTADTLISTPDKIMMRPIWFGSFANEFKSITGEDVDFDKIASNDEAYMNENKDALQKATEVADDKSTMAGATDNAFMGILKGTVKPNQSALTRGFNMFNNFMTRFLIFEYTTARTAINAAMGNGYLTRGQGVRLLAAVSTRMVLYTFISSVLGSAMVGLFVPDDEDEEKEKTLLQKFGQALASGVSGLLIGRDFGNAVKSILNYGVERVNENFLDFLREGEYDPYKDAISYSAVPIEKKSKRTDALDFIKNMAGPFSPSIKTLDLAIKLMTEEPKKQKAAIERQKLEQSVRLPLEVLGNLGLVPLYKDVRKVAMAQIYKDLKKAPEKSEEQMKKEKVKEKKIEILNKMKASEANPKKKKEIEDKIKYLNMTSSEKEEFNKVINDEEDKLLKGYENKTEMKRYDPDLYERTFGENSPYYKKNKYKNEVKKELEDKIQQAEDRDRGYVPKEKKKGGFGSQEFGSQKFGKEGFGSKKFGSD